MGQYCVSVSDDEGIFLVGLVAKRSYHASDHDPTKLFTGPWESFCHDVYHVPSLPIDPNGLGLVGNAGKGIERVIIPENGDWVVTRYGGRLLVDF